MPGGGDGDIRIRRGPSTSGTGGRRSDRRRGHGPRLFKAVRRRAGRGGVRGPLPPARGARPGGGPPGARAYAGRRGRLPGRVPALGEEGGDAGVAAVRGPVVAPDRAP